MKRLISWVKFEVVKLFKYVSNLLGYLLPVLVWIILSFYIAKFIVGVQGRIYTSDALSNVFSALFTVLAGVGSVLITLYIRKRDLDIHSFALLEPQTVQEVILRRDTDITLQFNIERKEEYIGKKFLVPQGNRILEFLFIKNLNGFYKLVHDSMSMEEGQCVFAIVNNGSAHAKAKKYWVLFKKRKIDSGTPKYTLESDEYYLEEPLENYGYRFPMQHSDDVLWIWCDKIYSKFLEANPSEFIVVIEYESVPTKKKIIQAYSAVIETHTFGNENKKILTEFNAILKDKLHEHIESGEFLDNVIRHSTFD